MNLSNALQPGDVETDVIPKSYKKAVRRYPCDDSIVYYLDDEGRIVERRYDDFGEEISGKARYIIRERLSSLLREHIQGSNDISLSCEERMAYQAKAANIQELHDKVSIN